MITALLNLFFDPIVIGFVAVLILWPSGGNFQRDFFVKVPLAIGIGLGITSIIFFFCRVFEVQFSFFIVSEVLLMVILGAILLAVKIKNTQALPPLIKNDDKPISRIDLLAIAGFIVIIAASLTYFIHKSIRMPHGEWDAWAVWNLRARFLFRELGSIKNAFSPFLGWSNPDYPLLIPASIARCWNYLGRETQIVPAAVSVIFAFSSVCLITSALDILNGKRKGILAAILLLGTPMFFMHIPNQYSDIALSFFFLATFVLLAFHDRFGLSSGSFLPLAGIVAGFAAWTKNEGLAFVSILFMARFITIAIFKGWKTALSEAAQFLLFLAPLLAVVVFFKLKFAPANYVSWQSHTAMAAKFTNLSLYQSVFKAVWARIVGFGAISVGMIPLLIIYIFLKGTKMKKEDVPTAVVMPATFIMMFIIYSLLYVTSPFNPLWHIASSIDRLILQMWPSLVFLAFVVVRNDV